MSEHAGAATPFPLYYFQANYDLFNGLRADDDQERVLRDVRAGGRTPGRDWTPLRLKMERGRRKQASDFPCPHTNSPVLSARAWAALRPLVGHAVEPLPVFAGRTEYVLLNVLGWSLPAFDADRSRGPRDDHRGLHHVFEFAFRPGVAIDADLFRVAPGVDRLFVTARFRAAVERAGLVGLLWVPATAGEPGRA